MTEQTAAAPPQPVDKRRLLVLALLFVVYTFNFIDRQIMGILNVPIQQELGASDAEMGLLGGLSFALFYTGLGIPIAWLADRSNRTWIMTAALTLWSGFTALCGIAQNYTQLFLARMGVGVGEAGGVAPAYSLISDYFPPRERARALAVYSFGIPIGSAAGVGLGGVIAQTFDWRVAFITVGLAGILIAPIFRLCVREPERGRYDAKAQPGAPAKAGLLQSIGVVTKKPSFWLLSFGASCSSIMGYGSFYWIPTFLQRSYGFDVLQAGYYYAAILLIGGVLGVWLGGMLGDKLGAKRRAMFALVPAGAWMLALPCYALGLLSPSPLIAFFLFLAPTALGLVWLGPVIAAVQHLAPASMRTTASASFLFINNLIGIGLGTYLLGLLSDALSAQYGEESLRYSILAGSGFYLVAALLYLVAARSLHRDWVD
ncbi:MAG TPA: MFS transporter [Vitreimonas sp.]|uniref:spinster family MFS transporter n=1 Tax=Vitreimonas sp. TaxID=3069702 RepID=UPI002D26CF2B|nr:MFS transporter [Vitreimonas sp.]HYD88570.1 MFS transporter [Vitreimonas sp.]